MGFYAEHIVPRILNLACGMGEAEALRRRVCQGLEGEVLEIGFGSGHNVPFYPPAVTRVAAGDPSDVGWKLAAKRLAATTTPVERSGLDGQSLPFADEGRPEVPGRRLPRHRSVPLTALGVRRAAGLADNAVQRVPFLCSAP
ncbi:MULTISPECIES: hypothetical protein [unclassified Streptomyces]|uniref:hypothetical protein n=1 Tax=unclassified Streptomyces TaxID=2593676 RepID=UPI003426C9E8